jgi:hypothetical protein
MDLHFHPLYVLMPLGSFLAILCGIAMGRVTEELRRETAQKYASDGPEDGLDEAAGEHTR